MARKKSTGLLGAAVLVAAAVWIIQHPREVAEAVRAVTGCAGQSSTAASCQDTTSATSPPERKTKQSNAKQPGPHPATTRLSSPSAAATVAALNKLAVKGPAPMTGYTREAFGQAWTDDNDHTWGHDGCDERNAALKRDLQDVTLKPGTRDCVVLTGILHDPYTGHTITFTRGANTSRAVQVDHVVAEADGWRMGAQQWPESKRVNFATDPLNLLAVDGPTNMAKRDSNAASWLPPNKSYRCAYVTRQVQVKAKYALAVTASEKQAIARILTKC